MVPYNWKVDKYRIAFGGSVMVKLNFAADAEHSSMVFLFCVFSCSDYT